MSVTSAIPCRLCGEEAKFRFSGTVLQAHEVGYFECSQCGSLETGEPYWLPEAYRRHLTVLDVGAAQRCLLNSMVCAYILEAVGITSQQSCLDWGGGDGLFTRMMRDRGFNFVSYDKYAVPIYSQGFSTESSEKLSPAVVTAFEVLEHLPHPQEDLEQLFSLNPALLIVTTLLYQEQGQDWWYLSPEGGQHVFFYSRKAMQSIASRFGYKFVELPQVMLFVSEERLLSAASAQDGRSSAAKPHVSLGGLLLRLRQNVQSYRRAVRSFQRPQGLRGLLLHPEETLDIAANRFMQHLQDPWRHVSADLESVTEKLRGDAARLVGKDQ